MSVNELDTSHFKSHIVISSADKTAIEHIAENIPLTKQKIKKAMLNGCVWLESSNGIHRIRRAKKILNPDDSLYIYYDEDIQNSKPEAAELIADEGEYSIWNKPYGMYSQGTKWGDHGTIYRWAEQHLEPQRPVSLVHRLDRAASGLIIIAHSKKTAAAFAAMFRQRQIQKQYRATVEGRLSIETLPFTITNEIDNKPAISKIIRLEPNNDGEDKTVVTIEIETGRKHQVRRHLSQLGFPITGDRLYGTKATEMNLQLQSVYLGFNCPVTNTMREYSLENNRMRKTEDER